MADLTVRVDGSAGIFDFIPPVAVSGDHNALVTGGDLETAVLASLFTWARADVDDEIPDGSDDRKGWWGDAYPAFEGEKVGSRLWLLTRRVLNAETMELSRQYAVEALQWLIDGGYVLSALVTPSRDGPNRMSLLIILTRPNGKTEQIRIADLWNNIGGLS